MASDAEVIQAVRAGQRDRYAELVDRYQGAAMQLAYGWVGNYEDAKDLSQNGFVKAYRHLDRFRGEAKFSTWLYRIIVNECKEFLRRRRPVTVSLNVDPEADGVPMFEVADDHPDPSARLSDLEVTKLMSAAIVRLPLKQRTALLLHHVHELSVEETAGVLRCRPGTVKSHLARATERLRRILAPTLFPDEEVTR